MTPEDNARAFLRLLEEDPAFREQARSLILTKELMDLPARFATFVSETTAFMSETTAFMKRTAEFMEAQTIFNQRIEQQIDELMGFRQDQLKFNEEQRQFNEEQRQFNRRIEQQVNELREFNQEQRQFNRRIEQQVNELREFNEEQRQFNRRIEASIGDLRGKVARTVVLSRIEEITEYLGLEYDDYYDRRAKIQMLRDAGNLGLPYGERRSFYDSDLVVRTIDREGNPRFIALEASYTADQRDTDRASRNAGLLSQATGESAAPAIASVNNDQRIQHLVASGQVLWFPLQPEDFTPE